MKERVDRKGRRIMICTEVCVFIPSAFTTRRNIRDGGRRFFFTLASGRGHVLDTGKASILVWRFDVGLDYPAEVDDDIATYGPASCTITTCFDGNGKGVVLAEADDSGSEGVVSGIGARVPGAGSRLTD